MKIPKLFLFLFLSCCISFYTVGQHIADSTSLMATSEQVTDAIILMQEQQLIDSVIRAEVQKEIQKASGDKSRIAELEARLREMNFNDSVLRANTVDALEKLRISAVGFPVAPFNDTLFNIYLKVASFKPVQRSLAISERIIHLYEDPFYSADSLRVVEGDYTCDIFYGSSDVIMSVTPNDALWFQKDALQIAKEYRDIIANEISEERAANSFKNWLIRIGLVLLIFFCLALLIFLINRLFRFVNKLLNKNQDKYLNGLTIAKVRLLTPEQFQRFVMRFTNVLRIIAIIIALYLSLPLLFSVFPETKDWTRTLISWTMAPVRSIVHGIVSYLPSLITVLVIFFIFRYTIKAIRYFVDEIAAGNIRIASFHADWAHPTFNILQFLMYALMLVLIFPYLPGSSSPAFQGVSVFIGILFSLGSTSAIANIMAGYVITYMRPFKVGDRVKIGEVTGDVMEKTMLVTKIKTIKNEDVTIPNSAVLSSSTINYSTNTELDSDGLILNTTVTIGYDVPWKQMHQALIIAANRVPSILKTPAPFVFQTSLDDFYVSYQINAYTREANKMQEIYSQLHCCIQDACNEAGIEIMSPHYNSLRDGNHTTIPSGYLGKEYKSPGFKMDQTGKG